MILRKEGDEYIIGHYIPGGIEDGGNPVWEDLKVFATFSDAADMMNYLNGGE